MHRMCCGIGRILLKFRILPGGQELGDSAQLAGQIDLLFAFWPALPPHVAAASTRSDIQRGVALPLRQVARVGVPVLVSELHVRVSERGAKRVTEHR